MKTYRFVRLRVPVGSPASPGSWQNAMDVFQAPEYTITLDGNMLCITNAAGQSVEVPFTTVLYAVRDGVVADAPKKGRK